MEKILLRAHAQHLDFSVIVVDSRPMLEGNYSFSRPSSGYLMNFQASVYFLPLRKLESSAHISYYLLSAP